MKLKSELYFTLGFAVQYPVGENPFIFGEKLSKVGKEFRSEISACFICQTRAGNWSQTPTFGSTEWCAFYSPQGWHCFLTWHQCVPEGPIATGLPQTRGLGSPCRAGVSLRAGHCTWSCSWARCSSQCKALMVFFGQPWTCLWIVHSKSFHREYKKQLNLNGLMFTFFELQVGKPECKLFRHS